MTSTEMKSVMDQMDAEKLEKMVKKLSKDEHLLNSEQVGRKLLYAHARTHARRHTRLSVTVIFSSTHHPCKAICVLLLNEYNVLVFLLSKATVYKLIFAYLVMLSPG